MAVRVARWRDVGEFCAVRGVRCLGWRGGLFA